MDIQEEIVRLLALDLRLRLENQADAIREMHKAGFGPARVADLLGTTAGTVNVTIAKSKKREANRQTKGESQ